MQIIEFCCEQFNFVFPSRQIHNRRDKFIKSDIQPTNLLTFVNINTLMLQTTDDKQADRQTAYNSRTLRCKLQRSASWSC